MSEQQKQFETVVRINDDYRNEAMDEETDANEANESDVEVENLEMNPEEVENEIKQEQDFAAKAMIEEPKHPDPYKDFRFNYDAIDAAVNKELNGINWEIHNKIEPIHPSINFYYNSLNLCLGKQGCGKTTFLMKELIKLDTLPDQGHYKQIIYVSNGGGVDQTFVALAKLIRHIPIYSVDYTEVIPMLQEFFNTRETEDDHIFVILEDATFLLLKESSVWAKWVTTLRHKRMTMWVNLHVWKAINPSIKTQTTTAFIFRGYNKENLNRIYYQSSISNLNSMNFYAIYQTLLPRQCLKVDNFLGEARVLTNIGSIDNKQKSPF